MPKVIIDMTMSLDGYVAGPEDAQSAWRPDGAQRAV